MAGPIPKRVLAAINQGNGHTLRRRFTVEDFYRMAAAGIFTEDDRVELVEGDIVDMMPIGPRHAFCVDALNARLSAQAHDRYVVRVQGPLRLSRETEVLPDILLLRPPAAQYATRHPEPPDVLLVVEVAETSLTYDRDVKGPLYARHGIPEYWLVDLEADRVWVHRRPGKEGYAEVKALGPEADLTPEALPDVRIPVRTILGK